jgi:hypothetical protein
MLEYSVRVVHAVRFTPCVRYVDVRTIQHDFRSRLKNEGLFNSDPVALLIVNELEQVFDLAVKQLTQLIHGLDVKSSGSLLVEQGDGVPVQFCLPRDINDFHFSFTHEPG